MNFCEEVWLHAAPIYAAIVKHPFNQELMQGTLDTKKFNYYIEQDLYFLSDYVRVLNLIASRCVDKAHQELFMSFARTTWVGEKTSIEDLFSSPGDYQPLGKRTLAGVAYTNYLIRVAAIDPLEVAIAACLPCPWVYWELAKQMMSGTVANNPYQKWITLYASPEFATSVLPLIDVVNALAKAASPSLRAHMLDAFSQSALLEWHFWQDAYWLSNLTDVS